MKMTKSEENYITSKVRTPTRRTPTRRTPTRRIPTRRIPIRRILNTRSPTRDKKSTAK